MTGGSVYAFGAFTLDRGRHRLLDGDETIHLKPKEWSLLCALVEHRDRVMSKRELLDLLWPRQDVTEANLSQTVYAVRRALGDSARRQRWIETVPRQGYRFVPPEDEAPPRVERRTEAKHAIDPAARAAYERGRYCWHRFTEPGLRQALAYFDEALALAPRFAEAHAWRSAAWSALGNVGAVTPRESAEHARRAADLAIAIDDSVAAGYEMRGVVELYFDWNFEAALRSFERAIERDPLSANAHSLRGNALAFSGRFEAAHASIARALELDPTALITRTDSALYHYLAGNFETARQRLESVLAQNPDFPHARLKLAFALVALGDHEAAVDECDRAVAALGVRQRGEQACILGLTGRGSEARDRLTRLTAQVGAQAPDPYGVALGHLGVGEHDKALEWLRRALEYRSRDLVLLPSDPVWKPLRGQAAFDRLVEAVGYG